MKNLKLLLFITFPVFLQAQNQMEGGVFVGFANYQGDLAEANIELNETKLSYGAFARYHLSKKLKIKANVLYGFISGDDANADESGLKQRGWKFDGSVLEFAVTGEYHPFGKSRYSESGIFSKQFSPFVGLGLGIANYNTTLNAAADQNLFPESGEKSTSIAIPILLGAKADLSERFSLGLEWGWRATLSDYADKVSTNGNPDRNDWYLFTGLTVSYFFGNAESFGFQKGSN